jgi:hypothetical protein
MSNHHKSGNISIFIGMKIYKFPDEPTDIRGSAFTRGENELSKEIIIFKRNGSERLNIQV